MNFKILFLIAAVAVGLTEYVKKILPAKWFEKKAVLPLLSGIISAVSAVVYGLAMTFTWQQNVVAALIVVALSQTCYSLLWKTFEAFKDALERKITEKISDKTLMGEAAEKAGEIADEAVEKVGKK